MKNILKSTIAIFLSALTIIGLILLWIVGSIIVGTAFAFLCFFKLIMTCSYLFGKLNKDFQEWLFPEWKEK